MMNSKLSAILDEYGVSHQNPINQKIHKVCVPLIMWSVLGLLASIPGPVNMAYVFIAASLAYYLHFKNLSIILVILAQVIPMMIGVYLLRDYGFKLWLGIFIAAWIGQFIGHKIEGKKPSFFQDVFFLLIGPLWILRPLIK
jgi:uncharacterized membrane protein YGL010W